MAKKTLRQQAAAVIRSKISITKSGKSKNSNSQSNNFKELQSVRSTNDTVLALAKIAENLNVERIKNITPDAATFYLEARRDNFASQKSLDRDRKALSIALGISMPRPKAISEQSLTSRSYSKNQIDLISNAMTERNSLALNIAYRSGLRTHELLTLKRADEGQRTASRTWSDNRFSGREGQLYLVTGKGGLTREILIPNELSLKLENRRLNSPVTTKDRGVNYLQRYDIGGGNALSSSFTRASQRTLSFSHGIHGVRHSYAQERMDEIKWRFKVSHEDARDIVAQELGHFRGDITETYLR